MNPIRNILVIVDPTATQHTAVAKGAALAEKFQARLDLFICDTKAARNMRLAKRLRDSSHETDLHKMLESAAAPLRHRGLDVTTEIVAADPLHTALSDRVRHTCAELVVKDTHHHTIAQRTFLTNTDWELIRGCRVSLLLVKPTTWSSAIRVGAAIDPGHLDDKPRLLDRCILEQASAVAQHLGGEVHAIHAYIPAAFVTAAAASLPPMVIDVDPEVLENERRAKLSELVTLTSDYQVGEANVHLEAGGVKEVLCRLAGELHIDMMTMGAVSRGALRRIVVGSTAESVLEWIPCDLLIVKAPNFAELLIL
jgi:universal stress protein E